MLIDDDTDYTSVLSGFMEQRGYLVETSQLVPGLMEDILRHKPTLLLMSMSSQKPEAIQLIREINDHSELSDMSLFVITGCVDAENALDQDICGRIDGFFLKPVSPSFLLSRISEELLKGQMASVFR
jgi:response regulator RpfG family c-di-GMP phosphodiesterase